MVVALREVVGSEGVSGRIEEGGVVAVADKEHLVRMLSIYAREAGDRFNTIVSLTPIEHILVLASYSFAGEQRESKLC